MLPCAVHFMHAERREYESETADVQKANKGFKQTVKTTRGAEEGEKRNRSRTPPHSAPCSPGRQTFDLQPNLADEKGVNAVGSRLSAWHQVVFRSQSGGRR